MRAKYAIVLLVVITLVGSSCAYAHHSFAATYYIDRTQTIEGNIVEFLYRNPHSYIKVEAPDDKGQKQVWAIEWAGGAQLAEEHVSRDTLKPGDHVIVSGNPARDAASHRIRIQNINRPSDGWKWSGVVR
ncbi:MAG: hypothetical protein DMG39_10635 [Acidobacteria bacterium]|nr:MAG: hypothetical protein DMG39_10635 [Acidobacteriota bacterium]